MVVQANRETHCHKAFPLQNLTPSCINENLGAMAATIHLPLAMLKPGSLEAASGFELRTSYLQRPCFSRHGAQACGPSPWEVEAGESLRVQG